MNIKESVKKQIKVNNIILTGLSRIRDGRTQEDKEREHAKLFAVIQALYQMDVISIEQNVNYSSLCDTALNDKTA